MAIKDCVLAKNPQNEDCGDADNVVVVIKITLKFKIVLQIYKFQAFDQRSSLNIERVMAISKFDLLFDIVT